ncbi:SDR family oxidoreductase [Pigmentiphaga sp. GD03639]|uniref:SDR family oxidoreductase n=1 Tax=Pigmentiphaga sp. GD03639 TaxID=2975354 RepID=UPI0024485CAC|nr:SDR family oxidoreductase [Pigmentiphaga sp. GD03639]MDH2239855.1 SDR family oxidoreductase [Pigmentiphaga sp. GD03639]
MIPSIQANWSRNSFILRNKVAVVTGATGILGRWFCAALADHGADIALVDQSKDVIEMAAWLSSQFSVNVRGYERDISSIEGLSILADEIEAELGPVDILHNNAATKGSNLDEFFSPVAQFSLETWREIMSVNLDAAFFVAREFGTRMAARGSGSIIQTASIYGIMGPDQRIYEGSRYNGRPINTPPVYSASKAGIVGLTKYLATYWGKEGVRVNTLTPGGVSSGQNKIFEDRYSARVPLGRMAQPAEMVGALIFLASDASRYVTGQNIVIDGGLSAW